MIPIEEQRALANTHPGLQEFIDNGIPLPKSFPNDQSVKDIRHFMKFLIEQEKSLKPRSKTKSIQVKSEIIIPDWESPLNPDDGTPSKTMKLKIKVYKPKKIPNGGCPVMLSFAGNGFVLWFEESAMNVCQAWTSLGGIAIDVQYRLAPEHPFPIPIMDCYEATRWVVMNRTDLGLDLEKGFVLGGESTGGHYALSVAHLWYERGHSPPLTGIYAPAATAVSPESVPEKYRDRFISYDQCANAPCLLDRKAAETFLGYFNPPPDSPLAWPVMSPYLSSFPRTYLAACGLDPVRDCSIVFDQVLKDAGAETRLDLYPGLPHAFWGTFYEQPWGKQAIENSKNGMKWLLRLDEKSGGRAGMSSNSSGSTTSSPA